MIVDEVLPDRHGVAVVSERVGNQLSIRLARARTGRATRVGPEGSRWTPPPWWPLLADVCGAPSERANGRSHLASHVLLASGDAWRSRTSNPGVGWTPGTDDDQRDMHLSPFTLNAAIRLLDATPEPPGLGDIILEKTLDGELPPTISAKPHCLYAFLADPQRLR
jgi:hypothetical protein